MKHSRLGLAMGAVALLAATSSCSDAGKVNIGDQQSFTPLKTGLVGSWDGYIEIYTFTDGSDRVRITVNDDGTGTIRFGNEDLWPPATDPNVKYPPDFPVRYVGTNPPDSDSHYVWNGFNYALIGLRTEGQRIRGTSWSRDVFGTWCALQTPNPTAPGDSVPYRCVPTCHNYKVGSPGLQDDPVTSDTCYTWDPCPDPSPEPDVQYRSVAFPCELVDLCNMGPCACDANSCALSNHTDDILLDASLDDTQQRMTGTLVLPYDGSVNYNVHLQRQ